MFGAPDFGTADCHLHAVTNIQRLNQAEPNAEVANQKSLKKSFFEKLIFVCQLKALTNNVIMNIEVPRLFCDFVLKRASLNR